jgi:hypothetical protein
VTRAARTLAVLASAVLGIAGGTIVGVMLGHDDYPDPLGLDAPLVNQACRPTEGLLLLATADDGRGLASALASYPDARYLQIAKSCPTTWRDSGASDRTYAAYLGPMSVGDACREQMTGAHLGDRVTRLRSGATQLELCLCYISPLHAPILRAGPVLSDGESVYLRALQPVLTSLGRRPDVARTDEYDTETYAEVRRFQQDTGRGHDGVVEAQTWETLIKRGCVSEGRDST